MIGRTRAPGFGSAASTYGAIEFFPSAPPPPKKGRLEWASGLSLLTSASILGPVNPDSRLDPRLVLFYPPSFLSLSAVAFLSDFLSMFCEASWCVCFFALYPEPPTVDASCSSAVVGNETITTPIIVVLTCVVRFVPSSPQ